MIEVKNPELNPSSNRARPLPWPLALALTAAVSAAHLWFLLAVPLQVGFNDDWLATSAPVLSTRVIEAAGPTPQKNQGQAAQANTQSTPNQIGNAAATGPSPGIAPAAPADAPSNSGAAGVQIAVSQLQEAAQNQSIAPTPPDPAAQAQSSPALPSKDAEPQAPSPAAQASEPEPVAVAQAPVQPPPPPPPPPPPAPPPPAPPPPAPPPPAPPPPAPPPPAPPTPAPPTPAPPTPAPPTPAPPAPAPPAPAPPAPAPPAPPAAAPTTAAPTEAVASEPSAPTPAPAVPAPPAQADKRVAMAVPGSAQLNYQVLARARGFELPATAQVDWQHDGLRYQARMVISSFPLPSRTQTSVGEIGPEGLSPRRFSEKTRNETAVHFQPEIGRIVFSNNSPHATWQAGAQDRLSLTFQLAAMIAGEPTRFVPGTQVTIQTAGSRNVEPWTFTVMDSQNLSLPMGEHSALRLRREPRHLYDQTIEVWFAPTLGHLPVRILIVQSNGDSFDQRLASVNPP